MLLASFRDRDTVLAIGLAVLLLTLHLVVIGHPADMVLDEQHYVPEAKSIIAREGLLHPEHPSLGKLLIASGIGLFGDRAFGWRISSVLFGVASILLVYLICRRLTSRRHVPILATFVFAFENMSFVQAGVAMLDVFSVTLMLASFLLYLHDRHVLSGVFLALSAIAKLTGAFGAGVILLHWFFARRRRTRDGLKLLLGPPLAFLALMPVADWLATGNLLYPWERIHYMITTHATLTFATTTAGNASHPWEWIVSPISMAFWYDPSYMSGVSWTAWALIVPSMGLMAWGAARRDGLCLLSLVWFACTYLTWIPIELISDRIMFRFYFYATVPAVCIAVGLALEKLLAASGRSSSKRARWAIRTLVLLWMVGHAAVFLLMGPLL